MKFTLHSLLLFLFLFLFFAGSSFAQNDSSKSKIVFRETQPVGKPFPLFYVKTDSLTWTNDSLKGKVVFINFWFESCPPCIAEMPALNELYKKLKDRPDVAFLSFSYESQEKLKLIKAKYDIPYTVATINKKECSRLNQDNGYPTTIILDKKGVIKFLKAGGYLDKEMVNEFINVDVYNRILAELGVVSL